MTYLINMFEMHGCTVLISSYSGVLAYVRLFNNSPISPDMLIPKAVGKQPVFPTICGRNALTSIN